MGRLKGFERKVVEYFNKRGFSKSGFLKYNYWYNRINYIIGNECSRYDIRKLFMSLEKKKYFNAKKIKTRSYLYEFVNKNDRKKCDDDFNGITITFE
jgi:REP element-mobilizing transposase RayT